MIKNIVVLLLFLTFSVIAEPITVAVNDLKGDGITPAEISIFSNRVRAELFNTGVFSVMERGEMNTILKEQEFQNSGACDESSCMVEMGQLLGVEKIVAGNIGKINNFYTISLRLVDISTGKIEKIISYDFTGSVSDLISKGLKIATRKLAGLDTVTTPSVTKAKVHITTKPTPVKLTINDTLTVKTPLSKELAPGSYKLLFTLEGYKPLTKQIKLFEGTNFSKEFQLKKIKERKRGFVTRIISGTIAATALTVGLVNNGKVNSYTAEARDLYNKSIAENDGEKYHDDYVAAKSNAESATVVRNISYVISGVSVTVFAISYAF